MLAWIVSLGSWNWFILAALLLLVEVLAPGMFMLWLGLSAILVGIISSAVVWSWQAQLIALPCSRSHPFRPGGISPARSRSPATARSSIAVPTAMLGESSRSIARSSMAPAPFTSTTPSGASPVPTAPPAAACGSHAPTERTCQSSAINDQATPARNKSWKFTMPTGLPASATINAVIFEELMISSASLAS